jgi:protein-L-isoaspartate(D-aspartate) O-methyltransferase
VEYVPQPIIEQAADGGQIALAMLDRGVTRLGIGRVVSGAFGLSTISDAAVAILPGFERPREFVF